MDELFGCVEWRNGLAISDQTARRDFFYGLYESQLREAGASQVLRFELHQGNRHVYTIFFGTQNTTGSDRMKQAIWKVAPFGDFAFRGTCSDQLGLGLDEPDYGPLHTTLTARFGVVEWVGIEEVMEFVKSDQTDYHSGQLKKAVLVPMELSGELEVDPNSRKRLRTFPNGTKMRFVNVERD